MKTNEIPSTPPTPRAGSGVFLVPFGKRLFLFACVTVVFFIIGAVIVGLIASKGTTPSLRVATIMQDIMLFIAPAIVTACFITRMPARFLLLDRRPSAVLALLGVAALFASVPAMNALVAWNEGLSLPESLRPLEEAMKQSEEAARAMVDMLIGDRHSIGSLVMALLIVGVMAGFSEEIYFRGTLQRLLSTGSVNPHVAVWVTAFIFSAVHMQFYGFFPRLLLGAFFGYMAWWAGSVWIPMIVHTVNNMTVVAGEFASPGFGVGFDTVGTEPTSGSVVLVAASVVLTALLLWGFKKYSDRENGSVVS